MPAESFVKLLHADDLQGLERFPSYAEWSGATLATHRARVEAWSLRRKALERPLTALSRLAELESDQLERYGQEQVRAGPGAEGVTLPLQGGRLPDTSSCAPGARILKRRIRLPPSRTERSVTVAHCAPKRVVHREEIERLRAELAALDPGILAEAETVRSSRCAHPILFVSHRWEALDHPDPHGAQLRRLRGLSGCFVIYDYSSFPQEPRTAEEERGFREILAEMPSLLSNVVVLAHPEYLTRGWCVYEYAVACLERAVVCDEVQEPSFVALREWLSTSPPVPVNPFRDSVESMQQNHINGMVLGAVNAILPVYRAARFREEGDEQVVSALLRDALRKSLPEKKRHQPYLGEWAYEPWTDEELQRAFHEPFPVPHGQTFPIARETTAIATTPAQAVIDQFRTGGPDLRAALLQWAARLGVPPPEGPTPCRRPECLVEPEPAPAGLAKRVRRWLARALLQLVTGSSPRPGR